MSRKDRFWAVMDAKTKEIVFKDYSYRDFAENFIRKFGLKDKMRINTESISTWREDRLITEPTPGRKTLMVEDLIMQVLPKLHYKLVEFDGIDGKPMTLNLRNLPYTDGARDGE